MSLFEMKTVVYPLSPQSQQGGWPIIKTGGQHGRAQSALVVHAHEPKQVFKLLLLFTHRLLTQHFELVTCPSTSLI